MAPIHAAIVESYECAYPDPLWIKAGETVELGAMDDEYPGWIWTVTKDGNAGWAPAVLFQSSTDRGHLGKSLGEDPDTGHTGSQPRSPGVCQRDYDATELTVVPGQSVEILERLNGWARVRIRAIEGAVQTARSTSAPGAIGWIPEHCLDLGPSH